MISNKTVLSRRTFFVGLKASAQARDHIVARAMPLNRWKVWSGAEKKNILMTRVFQHIIVCASVHAGRSYVYIRREIIYRGPSEKGVIGIVCRIYMCNVIRQTEGFRPSVYSCSRLYSRSVHIIMYTLGYCCRQNARPIVNDRKMFISAAAPPFRDGAGKRRYVRFPR